MKDDFCFCDLAALSALDLLDEGDRQALQVYVDGLPELREELEAELAELRAAAGAIAYTVPLMAPAPDLKERLFHRLGLAAPATEPVAIADAERVEPAPTASGGEGLGLKLRAVARVRNLLRITRQTLAIAAGQQRIVVRQQDAIWQPYQVPGVRVAPLYIDLAKREATAILQAEPGVSYPLHRHQGVEEIYMLEGDLVIGTEVFGAGDYIRSAAGSAHSPRTVGGCRFFVRTMLDDEFLEETALAESR